MLSRGARRDLGKRDASGDAALYLSLPADKAQSQ